MKRAGGEETIAVAALRLGDQVIIGGEQIPIDGLVLLGQAIVNQAPITGESLPVEKHTATRSLPARSQSGATWKSRFSAQACRRRSDASSIWWKRPNTKIAGPEVR